MASKFTPGPWRFNGNWLEPVSGNGSVILTYTNMDDGLHGSDADKALIATAPELYTALAAICDEAERMTMTMRRRMIFNDGLAALFKARGGEA